MASNTPGVRRCAACRAHAPKTEMIRICKSSDGEIFVDETGKADGRGAWVHRSEACVALAEKKRALNAAFRCAVPESVIKELYERV